MDNLDNLKYQLEKNRDNRERAETLYYEQDSIIKENERKIANKVSVLFEKERLDMESNKEIIVGSVQRLNHQQQINNQELIKLNDNLADMSDLKAIYEQKRSLMENNYQELKKTLESEIDTLKLKSEEYKKFNAKEEFKNKKNMFLVILVTSFFAILIGSWLGLGFVDFVRVIFPKI
jgi:RecG-like helicase